MIRTFREAKYICFSITDMSVIVCHRGSAGLGAWSHDFTLPREVASVVEFERGFLNDHILIDVGGIPIAMVVGRRDSRSLAGYAAAAHQPASPEAGRGRL
jgi:hypothetical protein